jgi:hypothetical protein
MPNHGTPSADVRRDSLPIAPDRRRRRRPHAVKVVVKSRVVVWSPLARRIASAI